MTVEKVKQIALDKYGKGITDEQANAFLSNHNKPLSDDELDSVTGGCDDLLWTCPACGGQSVGKVKEEGQLMMKLVCANCGQER